MACALTQGYSLDCRDAVGGIKKIYFTERANKNQITAASGIITTFTLTTGKKFFPYDLFKEAQASFTENITPSGQNGTLFYEQMLTLPIRKMQANLRNEIKLLAQNSLMAIVLDRNDKYWLLGEANGIEMEPSTGATGVNRGDFNGYTLNFKGLEEAPAQEVTSSLIASLLIAAA